MDHALYKAHEVLKMLPNEAPNPRVVGYGFVGSVWKFVACRWTFDSSVVEEGDSDMGYFGF